MKRTLMTIALTTVVVLTLVGVVSQVWFAPSYGNTFSTVSRSLDSGYGGGAPQIMMEAPAAAPAPMIDLYASDSKVAYDASNTAPLADVERKIIKNADLSVVVKDPVQSMADITALAEQLKGYVVSSHIYQSTYGPNNITAPQVNINIRIPADKLNDALEQIKNSAVEVQSENVSGQDVTDQYTDLKSRLKAKQAAEKKLLEILDKTEKSEDTLAVYTQVQQVQSDIEVLTGQINYIDQLAAMSSVNVNLIADVTVQPIEIGGWKLQGTARQAIMNLDTFTKKFVEFLINFFLDYLWRIAEIVLPLFGVYIGGRALYRRFYKSKESVVVKEEEKK